MQYVVLGFVLLYLLFLPLCVKAIVGTDFSQVVGTFAAVLLLPINDVGTHLMAHPATQGVLFAPVVLYLVFRYLTDREADGFLPVSGTGVLLALASAALVFVHPQMGLAMLAIFATVSLLQYLARRGDGERAMATQQPLYGQTLWLGLVFVLWTPRFQRFDGTASAIVTTLTGGAPASSAIAERTTTLSALGGSVEGLFLKLFAVGVVFSALAAVVMFAWLVGRLEDGDSRSLVAYLTVSMVPLVGLFGLAFLVDQKFAFRYLGFIMVPVTILGSLGVVWIARRLSLSTSRSVGAAAVVVLFAILVPLSGATLFSSPIIYQPSDQVSEQQFAGHRTVLEHRSAGVPVLGLTGGIRRYADAVYGTERSATMDIPREESDVPAEAFDGNLAGYYNHTRQYIVVTDKSQQVERDLYKGLRYPPSAFDRLETEPGLDRVMANGGVRLYMLNGGGS
ncbi:MAG: hypothetical protein ABEJ31_06315 [Haloarculaceae archaeon]